MHCLFVIAGHLAADGSSSFRSHGQTKQEIVIVSQSGWIDVWHGIQFIVLTNREQDGQDVAVMHADEIAKINAARCWA